MKCRDICFAIVFVSGILGSALLAKSVYLPAKAVLAQMLIKLSYYRSDGDVHYPPWPWADTYPIARLSFEDTELFVLEGTNLRNLAFGPTRVDVTFELNSSGTKVVVGHRDTHFAALETLDIGNKVTLQTSKADERTFVVEDIAIVDRNDAQLPIDQRSDALYLVTCYPFNSIVADPHLRYVVKARRLVNEALSVN